MMLPISLRTRLVCIFIAMTSIVMVSSFGLLWNTHQTDSIFKSVVQKDLILYRISQQMELALANQKGFLTYYFVDGDAKWLRSLGSYRELFKQSLEEALMLDLDDKQKTTLELIARKYKTYREAKDIAIDNYKSDVGPENISILHEKQRDVFFDLLELCRVFNQEQWQVIQKAEKENLRRSERLRLLTYASIVAFVVLCVLFLFILYKHILGPIRDLAIETGSTAEDSSMDEVESLSHSLKDMMKDFDETHDELAKSRKHLLQAERMAMVGELAAGVAHTIRNPFTSIKMRMFSLSRSINLTEIQNEDLQVISDEIDRIDNIVKNFLDFSRPPKLRFEACSLGELIDSIGTLMEYRLEKYNVDLVYDSKTNFSDVAVDSDRIKEALLNLITNSCEAMEAGGKIFITQSHEQDSEFGEVAVVRIRDTGPGIPESLVGKVITPFFTTKEEGSGLGLSIVARIVREHGGELVISSLAHGTEIIIKLPAGRGCHERHTDH